MTVTSMQSSIKKKHSNVNDFNCHATHSNANAAEYFFKKKIIPIPVILMHPIINKKQSYANTFNAEPNNFNCHGSNFNSDKSK